LDIAVAIEPTISINNVDRKNQVIKFKLPDSVDKPLRPFLFELIRVALTDSLYEALNFTEINARNASCEIRFV